MKVFMIVIDSLRYDMATNHMLLFSRLKALSNTLTFEKAFSSGTSTPFAFPGLLASEYSFVGNTSGILETPITLAEVMKEKGFETYGNAGNNAHLSNVRGYHRGFDVYSPIFPSAQKSKSTRREKLKKVLKDLRVFDLARTSITRLKQYGDILKLMFKNTPKVYPFERMFEEIKDFLKPDKKQFVFLNIMDVHGPYFGLLSMNIFEILKYNKFAKIKYLEEDIDILKSWRDYYSSLYTRAVENISKLLEEMFNFLDMEGYLKDSIVVLTSDHGEEFLEHGGFDHRPKPFEEIIHVPLLVYVGWETFLPGDKENARNRLISLIDIPQSLVTYLFKKPRREFMGFNTIFGNEKREYIYAEGWRKKGKPYHDPSKKGFHNYAFRTKEWKYMVLDGKECFYDLASDPLEKKCSCVNENTRNVVEDYKRELKKQTLVHKIANLF